MREAQNSARPKDIWKGAKVLAIAIVAGAAIFILVALVINQVYGPFKPEWKEYRTWLGIVFSALRRSFDHRQKGDVAENKQSCQRRRKPGIEITAVCTGIDKIPCCL